MGPALYALGTAQAHTIALWYEGLISMARM